MEHKFQIVVQQQSRKDTEIDCSMKETLLEAMIRQGIMYRSDCGGRGTCGKCKIKILQGELSITSQDMAVLSEKDRQEGYHLACKAMPREDLTISLDHHNESNMKIIADSRSEFPLSDKFPTYNEGYVIGIDLGTTTLAFRLIDKMGGNILATHTAINPQRAYGADVVSRMRASNEGKKEQLKELIRNCLREGIVAIIQEADIDAGKVDQIALAGNTTMIHLLMGYSCESLGVYPFIPVRLDAIILKYKELFPDLDEDADNKSDNSIDSSVDNSVDDIVDNSANNSVENRTENNIDSNIDNHLIDNINKNTDNDTIASELDRANRSRIQQLQERPVVLLPGISTFVGGDIVAGLAICGFDAADEICLLIDLGTNGEIAIGNKDKIIVSSTAAGPAFEGGNVSCGVGSIPGAISHVTIHNNGISFETIGEEQPIGICGTGVVELASELYRTSSIDKTGLLIEDYFSLGYPLLKKDNNILYFTQKDIRELQLAKAAVRAGIEILLKRYGVTYNQVAKVYLAGGFGFYMDIAKAIHIGLLPEEFRDKIIAIGNSSLTGAIQYAANPDFINKFENILAKSQEIHLSKDEDFNELYLNYMSFSNEQE